ncbi:MAG: dienelactone hydrolase family protein [Roseibium sp.]|nr:dienelactone hydrolase family protein [Roseibium sp.]
MKEPRIRWSRTGLCIAISTLFVALAGLPGNAWSQGTAASHAVTFELPRAPLTPLQKKRLPESARNIPQGAFSGELRLPPGDGPHPALVVVRTCHDASYYQPWLARLQGWGYATLTFSRCQPPDFVPDDAEIPALDWKRGSLAAIGALAYLADRPEIDGDRIGVMSWSRLGMIPLSTLQYEGFAQFFDTKFAAGVALYPFCSFARGPHMGPILIVGGADDSWIDNTVCERVEQATRDDEFPVRTVLLENAVHGFDIPEYGAPAMVSPALINPDRFAAPAGLLGYNEQAAEIAIGEVKDFLETYLK